MCYNSDYLRALFAVDSLRMRCFKLGMRQALSFAATFLTESLSLFLVSSLSDYTFLKYLLCLKVSNSNGHPSLVTTIFSASTFFPIYAVNPLPNNHGGQTTHLHQPLKTDSHARPRRQQLQSRLQSEVRRPNNKQRKAAASTARPVNVGEGVRKVVLRIHTWSHCMDCDGIFVDHSAYRCCCAEERGEPGIGNSLEQVFC